MSIFIPLVICVYGATKTTVRSFTRSWAAELKHRKIRVNAINPGPIDTPGLRGFVSGLAPSEKQTEQVKRSIISNVRRERCFIPGLGWRYAQI